MISSPLVAPRLVGRDDECAFLMRRLDDVLQQGTASFTLIEGEPGMGKTRLLAELRRRAQDVHATALSAQALEHVREPYAPFALAASRGLEDAPPAPAAEMLAIAAALDPDVAQHKVKRLRAVAAALRGLLRERAVAIFFEDAHWADRASLDLLSFFAVELASMPLFVVVTQRPTPAPLPLADAVRAAAHTVRLGPLADRDVATLLREALRGQGSLGADRLRRITSLAGGNPLFALELLRNALAGAPDDVAPAIAYPIVRRWESLDRQSREILAAAAATGEIEPSFVALVAGCGPDAVEHALDRAQRLHLVELERRSGRWRFGHALTRAAIETEIAPRQRPAIHRRIGELLEARADAVEPARLAYHWTFAGDRDRTARYNEAAGDRAVVLHDYNTAQRFFETALGGVDDDPATVARLNEKLAAALLIEAATARAAEPIEIALRAFETLGDDLGVARMEMHRSRRAWFVGDPAETLAAAERALVAAEPVGPSPQLFDVRVRLAQIHQIAGRVPETRRELDAADALRDAGTPDATIRFLNARAMFHADAWDVDSFLADYREAIALAERIGHVELLVSTQNNLALNAFLTGRPDVALATLEESIATSFEFGMRWHVANALMSLARVRYVFGNVGGARQALLDALGSSSEARRLEAAFAGYGIPIALAARDETLLERCADYSFFEEVLDGRSVFELSMVAVAFADLGHARGEPPAALASIVGRALGALRDDARPLHLCAKVAQFGADDDLERARSLLAAPQRDRSRAAERALFDAYVAARRRRRVEASQRALEAAAIYHDLHWVFREAEALELAGREAEALRLYRAAGSTRDAARLEASARSADPLAPLTPREREVARLVLDGRSNRETGELLGLSERTVGNHLQSIFNRLGIGSRRELAEHVDATRAQ